MGYPTEQDFEAARQCAKPISTPKQKPSVGRIVHYYDPNEDEPCAAIITYIYPDYPPDQMYVALRVFTKKSDYAMHPVTYSETPKSGFWSWPPRV